MPLQEDPTWDSFHPYQRELGAGTSIYTDTNNFFKFFLNLFLGGFNRKEG
jgi:hypothetical protein